MKEKIKELGFVPDHEFKNLYSHPESKFNYVLQNDTLSVWINLEYELFTLYKGSIETFLNLEKYG